MPAICGGARSSASAPRSPTSSVDYLHVDAATIFLVTDPARFDVIVTDNLFGDIITDLAAAVTGGIGLAAAATSTPTARTPRMFEPVHGSAPDIAGQGSRRPDRGGPVGGACCWSTSGTAEAAGRVEAAVAADLATRGDGSASTAQVRRRYRRVLAR